MFDNGYQYGVEIEGEIKSPNREKILFQRYFTHEIYNMVKRVQDKFINIDINFRFSWKGINDSAISDIKLNDIHKYIEPCLYKEKKYNILSKELFFVHLCCHFANEAWFFLLDTEYDGGDPQEIRLFRLLDICLLLKCINMNDVWKIAQKLDCVKYIEYVGGIIKVVLGEKFALRFFPSVMDVEVMNKYMTVDKEWKEWPVSLEERLFMPEIREGIGATFSK